MRCLLLEYVKKANMIRARQVFVLCSTFAYIHLHTFLKRIKFTWILFSKSDCATIIF